MSSQAEQIGTQIIKWVEDWPYESRGKSMIMKIIVGDTYCKVEVTPKGSWSELHKKMVAKNIKWLKEGIK